MISLKIHHNQEWISFFDIGKIVNIEEYNRIENLYISCIKDAIQFFNIDTFQMKNLERYDNKSLFENTTITNKDALLISKSVLREEFWCILVSTHLEIHFGYDYCLYLVSKTKNTDFIHIFNPYIKDLHIETKLSPYIGLS